MRTAALFGTLLLTGTLAAEPARKNVVLLVADDLGMEVGCYGDKAARTPNIDALARAGTRFTHGFASVSSCSPSRAAILTGLPTHQSGQYGLAHDTHNFHTFRNVQSLPRLLKPAGYRTGVIAKLHVQPPEVYPWDAEVRANGRNGAVIAAEAKKFIEASGDKPFFLLVGFTDPHRARRGFDSQNPLRGMPTFTFDPKALPLPYHVPDQPEARADLADYYGSVSRLDFGVGAVLDVLNQTKHDADTLVVFLSDNGMPFPGAKTTLYDAGVHLPLVVRAPGGKAAVNDAMVSWTDVAPTVLDWAGVKPPAAMLGKSLLPLLGHEGAKDRDVIYGSHQFHEVTMYYPMRMVRTRTHKLIVNLAHELPVPSASDLYNSDTWQGILRRNDSMVGKRPREMFEHRPREEFFDLAKDPDELKNVAGDAAYADVLKDLRTKLKAWQVATRDPWLVKDTHE
jgi:N-sulfoglucosamine sulfohydrolase